MFKRRLALVIVSISITCVGIMVGYDCGVKEGNKTSLQIKQALTNKYEAEQMLLSNLQRAQESKLEKLNSVEQQLNELKQQRVDSIMMSRGGYPDRDTSKMKTFTITAYSPYDNVSGIECDGNPNNTSTGTKPKPGTIAVDPKVIPYGSAILVVYDDGTIELGKAEDCGGWVKGNHIDVFRQTYKEADAFGVKKATVLWYKEEVTK